MRNIPFDYPPSNSFIKKRMNIGERREQVRDFTDRVLQEKREECFLCPIVSYLMDIWPVRKS